MKRYRDKIEKIHPQIIEIIPVHLYVVEIEHLLVGGDGNQQLNHISCSTPLDIYGAFIFCNNNKLTDLQKTQLEFCKCPNKPFTGNDDVMSLTCCIDCGFKYIDFGVKKTDIDKFIKYRHLNQRILKNIDELRIVNRKELKQTKKRTIKNNNNNNNNNNNTNNNINNDNNNNNNNNNDKKELKRKTKKQKLEQKIEVDQQIINKFFNKEQIIKFNDIYDKIMSHNELYEPLLDQPDEFLKKLKNYGSLFVRKRKKELYNTDKINEIIEDIETFEPLLEASKSNPSESLSC